MSKKSKAKKKELALKKKRRKAFGAFLICLLVLTFLAGLARLVVFDTVKITSSAMSPEYEKGDIVLVNKLTLWKSFDIKRGDTVYTSMNGETKLIRKVCGMPGDLIDVRQDGSFLVDADGSETLLPGNIALSGGTIPEGTYLLLNINLTDPSPDGRTLGLTRPAEISGIPETVIWPLNRALAK